MFWAGTSEEAGCSSTCPIFLQGLLGSLNHYGVLGETKVIVMRKRDWGDFSGKRPLPVLLAACGVPSLNFG